MSKIKSLDMSKIDVITALADGNVGALTALIDVVKLAATVDPDNGFGAMGAALQPRRPQDLRPEHLDFVQGRVRL